MSCEIILEIFGASKDTPQGILDRFWMILEHLVLSEIPVVASGNIRLNIFDYFKIHLPVNLS